MKIRKYSIDSPIKGICKSHGIWLLDEDRNCSAPVMYLRKPKAISQKVFDLVLSGLSLTVNFDELEKAFEDG